MAIKKDLSWLNLATNTVQILLALGLLHFHQIVYNVELLFILTLHSLHWLHIR